MMTLTGKIARIIFAVPFAIFGIFHFMNAGAMAGMLQGWPFAELLVYFTGLCLIAAALAMIFNKYARLAGLLLALLLLIIVLFVHMPGLGDPEMMQRSMSAILKDVSLIGGALMVAGILDNNVSTDTKEDS